MAKILNFLKPHYTHRLPLCIILSLFLSLLGLAYPEVLRLVTDSITEQNRSMFVFAAILAVSSMIISITVSFFNQILTQDVHNRYEESVQAQITEKLIGIKKIRLQKFKTGEITTQIVNISADAVRNSIGAVSGMARGIFAVGISLAYMLILSWQMTAAVALFMSVVRVVLWLMEKKIKSTQKKVNEIAKSNNSFMFDMLKNMLSMRVFRKEAFFNRHYSERERETMRADFKLSAWHIGHNDSTWALMKLLEFGAVLAFGGFLLSRGYTTIGVVLAFTVAIQTFGKGIDTFSASLASKARALTQIDSVEEISNIQETEENKSDIYLCSEDFTVEFKNVSFSFSDDEEYILKNINFKIQHNEKILIKGPNGHGKTTLLNLISALYRPSKGEICYANKDISIINLNELVRHYTFISQNSNILQGNIYQNIILSPNDPTEEDKIFCNEILQKLGLEKQHETAPQNLSTGEKQRLNIARSLYRLNTVRIVIADEIFANIDKSNTDRITQILENELKNHAVIMICHENINFKFDRVFTVENKELRISEAGA